MRLIEMDQWTKYSNVIQNSIYKLRIFKTHMMVYYYNVVAYLDPAILDCHEIELNRVPLNFELERGFLLAIEERPYY